jgi:hypothetical protein
MVPGGGGEEEKKEEEEEIVIGAVLYDVTCLRQ